MYQKLRTMRIQKGYTIDQMAKMLGISKPYYSQIENRLRRLSYDMAVKIADIFESKPDVIFYNDFLNKKK